ncbi:MAG: hypothetical protein IPM26_12375 [Saprospiraceae bacterium]|nr:hypothetical protein [Saprospiraceae bacterium]
MKVSGKKILTGMFLFLFILNLKAQKELPVSWTFEVSVVDMNHVEVKAVAAMKKSWVIYSQFTEDDGPIPTGFYFDDKQVKFEELSPSITEFDDMFGVNVTKFKEQAVFKAKFPANPERKLKGYVTYMTCDGAKCLPPKDVEIVINW